MNRTLKLFGVVATGLLLSSQSKSKSDLDFKAEPKPMREASLPKAEPKTMSQETSGFFNGERLSPEKVKEYKEKPPSNKEVEKRDVPQLIKEMEKFERPPEAEKPPKPSPAMNRPDKVKP